MVTMGDGSKKTEATTNESDPLTLHHYNHLDLVLASKLLQGDNLEQWSRATQITLSAEKKIDFINGTVKVPLPTDPKFTTVLSWILNSVNYDILGSVIYAEIPMDVWNDLHDRFSGGNDTQIYQIRQEIVEQR